VQAVTAITVSNRKRTWYIFAPVDPSGRARDAARVSADAVIYACPVSSWCLAYGALIPVWSAVSCRAYRQHALLSPRVQRPWGSMCSTLDFPKSWPQLERRVVANFAHYRTNYAVLLCALVMWSGWLSWRVPLSFALLSVAWMYLLAVRSGPLVVSGYILKIRDKLLLLLVSTVVVLLVLGILLLALLVLALAVTIMLLHAALRPPMSLARLNRFGADVRSGIRSVLSGSTLPQSSSGPGRPLQSEVEVHRGDDGDEDETASFMLRSAWDVLRALLGVGKLARGGGHTTAASAQAPGGGESKRRSGGNDKGGWTASHAFSSGGEDLASDPEGRMGAPHAPHLEAPDAAAASSGPGMRYAPTSTGPGMPVFFDAVPAGPAYDGADQAYGAVNSALHRRGGPGAMPAPPLAPVSLPRPAHVRSD